MLNKTLSDLIGDELYSITSEVPGVRGRVLMAAAKITILEFNKRHPDVVQSLVDKYRAKDLDTFLSDDFFGADNARLLAVIEGELKSSPELAEEFKDDLVNNAFESADMLRFVQEGGSSRFYVYRKDGVELVARFTPTPGANERQNIVQLRYLDQQEGRLIQATVTPAPTGRGFMGTGSDDLPAGYIPGITYQRQELQADGSYEFVDFQPEDDNPINLLMQG